MNRKVAIIVIGISLILVTLVLVFYLQLKSKFTVVSPLSQVTPTPILEEMTTWSDPAQFSFLYPKSLAFDPHVEDQINYAHVELKDSTHPGNLIIWVKDTNAATIDELVTQDKIKNALDSTLDSLPAKKVLTTGGAENKIILSAINNGYLYQIEVNPTDNDFWDKIFNQVVSSFKFTSSNQDNDKEDSIGVNDQGSDQGTNQGTDEGEEVIE